jgi:hypothetical protein
MRAYRLSTSEREKGTRSVYPRLRLSYFTMLDWAQKVRICREIRRRARQDSNL